jgi:hypothetical protein
MKTEPKIKRTLDVAKYPLDQVEMRLSRCMHVQTCLLNRMSNIGASQGEILESPCKTAILRRISQKRTLISGELATRVNRSDTWVAVEHAGVLEKIGSILALRK